jgi:serine phosphatase RsbU (regulator of sigma subunit)
MDPESAARPGVVISAPRPEARVVRVASGSLLQLLLTGVTLAATCALFLSQAVDHALGGPGRAHAIAAVIATFALVVLPAMALRRETRLLRSLGRLLSASTSRLGHGQLTRRADVLDALETISRTCADELVAARRTTQELREQDRVVRRVLEQMAPPRFTRSLGGLEVSGFSRARGRAGGDWYVVRPLDGRHVLLALGDVAGHNPASAYAAAAIAGALRVMSPALVVQQPGQALLQLEELVTEVSGGALTSSAVLVVVDQTTWQARFVNAGHPAPWVLRGQTIVSSLAASGGPLGLRREAPHVVRKLQLERDDRLLFLSDGVLDQPDAAGRLFGVRRMLASTRAALGRGASPSSEEVLADLVKAFYDFAGQKGPKDDVSVVVCHVVGAGEPSFEDDFKTDVSPVLLQ